MREHRDQFLDFSKGILICLVIIGHIIQYGSGSEYYNSGEYFNNWVMKFIYSFHMPLFVFISGYFTRFSYEKTIPSVVAKKRIIKLIHPIIIWTLFKVLLACIFKHNVITLQYVVNAFFTSYWFLWTLVYANIALYLTEQIKGNLKALAYVLFFVFALLSPDVLWLHAYKYTIPFFYLGYYKAKISHNYEIRHPYFWCIMFLVLLVFYNKDAYIYTSMFAILGKNSWNATLRQVYIDGYRYLIAVAGCTSMLYLWKVFWDFIGKKRCIGKLLCAVGRRSLAIYVLSTLIFEFAFPDLAFIQKPSLFVWAVLFVVVLGICWITSFFVSKVPRLSDILGI